MTEQPTIEQFEKVRRGHRVVFSPRDAIGGARGLRKQIIGVVANLDPKAGIAQVGDWIVPVKKLQRAGGGAFREFAKVRRKTERERIYGALSPAEKKKLQTCAQDARAAFLSTTPYSGPANKAFYTEMKGARERLMRERGITDTSDRGQCKALPLFIERALHRGKVPELRGVKFVSADTGMVAVGDSIKLAGHKFKITGYTTDGQIRLEDGHKIIVPSEFVPKDTEAPKKPVVPKSVMRPRQKAARRAVIGKRRSLRPRRTRGRYRSHSDRRIGRLGRRRWGCFTKCRGRQGRFIRQNRNRRNPWGYVPAAEHLGRSYAALLQAN